MEDYFVYKLEHQHLEIKKLLFRFDENSLHLKMDGKWSVSEHIAHLGRYQEIFHERLQFILKGDCPSFSRYIAEKDSHFAKWQTSKLTTNIKKLEMGRTALIHVLKTLASTDFDYPGEHPTFGKMTLKEWIVFFLYHESHHLYQIFRLKHRIQVLGKNIND